MGRLIIEIRISRKIGREFRDGFDVYFLFLSLFFEKRHKLYLKEWISDKMQKVLKREYMENFEYFYA